MYYQATVALLLIDHDNEGFLALHKTTQSFCMPGQLRFLFVKIVVEGFPALSLWESFKDHLILDHVIHLHNTSLATDATLNDIQHLLHDSGKTLQSLGLPEPTCRLTGHEVEAELTFCQQ